jgi:hypothetical protein
VSRWLPAIVGMIPALTLAQMSPDCDIKGFVTDDRGAAVSELFLTAYSLEFVQGRRILQTAGTATTQDDGAYCLKLIRSGTIYLATTQWFDFNPPKFDRPDATARSLPSTWYPEASEFKSAQPVGVGTEADFHLTYVPSFTISGSVSGLESYQRLDLSALESDGIQTQNGIFELSEDKKHFTLSGLSGGEWTFIITASSGTHAWETRSHYKVDRNINDANLVFAPWPHVPIVVDGKPYAPADHSSFFLSLYRPSDLKDIQFGLPDLPPGEYRIFVPPVFGSAPFNRCIESFSPGDVPVENGDLLITPREYKQPISITTGQNCAKLVVHRTDEPDSAHPSLVLVAESAPFAPIEQQIGPAETYHYPWPLSPGTYRAYLFSSRKDLPYRDPVFLSHFSSKPVTVDANHATEVTLPMIEWNPEKPKETQNPGQR